MTFTTNGLHAAPFYIDDTTRYHAYFHRAEPEVVFGSTDTGVTNRPARRPDVPRRHLGAGHRSHSHGQFRAAVGRISADWGQRGPAHSPTSATA